MNKLTKIFSPLGDPNNPTGQLAARRQSLAGLRLGLLDNGKEFSDVVLEALADTLKRDFAISDLRFWRKGYPAKLAPFLAEMARETDAVISGVGH